MLKGIFFVSKYFWEYQKKYFFYKILSQILTATIPLADTVIPKFIIDELTDGKRVQVVFTYIAILLLVNLFGYWLINYFTGSAFLLKSKVFTEFQTLLADKLSRCDYERLEDPEFLNTKQKAEKFLYANGQGFAGVLDDFFDIFGKLFTFVGIVVVISTLNIGVVLAFVAVICLNTYFDSRVRKRSVEWDMEKTPVERKTAYYLDLIENFAFGKEIRMYGIRKWLVNKIHTHLIESNKFYEKQTRLSNRTRYISTFMNLILKGVTYVYLALKVIDNTIGIGDFTMYVTALMSFSDAMTSLMGSLLNIRQYGGYYEALEEYMRVPQKMYEGKRLPIPNGPYVLKFENISFKYPGQRKYALKNVTLTLHSGEKLSVVGENGAGKTTFVKLLCRLYDPTDGKITLNGTDIRDIDYDEYMNILCSVFQDYKLLAFTLKENVAFQKASFEDNAKIDSILINAGLSNKLSTLSHGIHTNVYRIFSEDGFEPSGGEGQKIALARAIYKDAPIMILDEPTAALDPRAEYEIYRNFSKMTKGKTTVFISHRLSSAKFCDHVVLFKNGVIAEYGTHDELIKKGGIYKELFDMQAKYYR